MTRSATTTCGAAIAGRPAIAIVSPWVRISSYAPARDKGSKLETDTGGILIPALDIIDRQGYAGSVLVFRGNGFAQVSGECGDAALPGQVIAYKGYVLDGRMRGLIQKISLR